MSGNPPSFPSFPSLPGLATAGAARKLRICIASCEFIGPIRNGGIGTAYTAMAHALVSAGHDVTLLYTQGSLCENHTIAHWEKFYREHGLRFIARPSDPALRIDAPSHAVRSYETYRWLKSQTFDVVHFPEWSGDAYYSLLARRQGLAFGHTLFCLGTHSPTAWLKEANSEYLAQPRELELDYMERRCVALADVVVSPCQYMLGWMRDHGFELPARSYVQQNLLPASARALTQLRPGGAGHPITELVFFGRLETRKGIELFCSALDQVKSEPDFKDLQITFLGKIANVHGRDSRAFLRQRTESWKWNWKIISDLDQPAAMRYLNEPGRMAVIPSLMENSPYTVLECLGGGIPFLASRVGGIPELIAPADVESATFLPNPNDLARLLSQTFKSGARPWTPAVDPETNELAWLAWHSSLAAAEPPSNTATLSADLPLVSVCVPHFNRPKLLQQALDSLVAQDYPNFEVIVVDDGSTAAEAVEFLKQIEPTLTSRGWRLVRQENRYLSAARNTGARQARGEYLLFMDDDNFAKPQELSTFVAVARRTGADIVTCGMDYFEGTTPPAADGKPVTRWVPLGPAPAAGYFRNCFGDANCLVRKGVFDMLGGFTELYGVTHEDWEFLANAVLQGCSLEVIPEALFHYRFIADSMIRSTSQYQNHQRHIRPYLDRVPPALRPVLLVAQGACIEQTKQQVNHHLAAASVRWQSQFEAGRILARLGHRDAAHERFRAGVKAAEATGLPVVILEALSAIGGELRSTDPAHARELLEIGLKLAEALKRNDAIQNIKALISGIPRAPKHAVAAGIPGAAPASDAHPLAVSIIIPAFNRLDLTRACLEALRRNTPADLYEVLVIDNASTDGSAEFLKTEQAAGRLRAVLNQTNLGFARASNQGAAAARGRYLLFLNNDTEVQAGWLQPLIALADADPQVGAVGSKLLFPDGTLQHAGVVILNDRVQGDPLLASHLFHHQPQDLPDANQPMMYQALTAACLLVPKVLFDQLGGFDEQYRNGYEDVDLCFKIGQAGRRLVYQPTSVVVHHESQSGPERFRHAPQNIQRLHEIWQNRIQPDFVRDSGGLTPIEPRKIAPYQGAGAGPLATGSTAARCVVSIVILALNQLEHTRRCLESIASGTPVEHEVIVIDNGSSDGTPEFLREWQQTHPNCTVVRNTENRGFAAGNNQGLSLARGEQVVLLNNDTIVTPGWLDGMLRVLATHPTTGAVGPMSDNVSGPQQIPSPGPLAASDPAAFAADWARLHGGESVAVTRAVGFCLLARRALIERIGGLDEQFGSGNFEDDDFCLRARLAGFDIRIARGVYIHHVGSQTFKGAKIDYRQAMLRNWDLFRAKWKLPAEASLERGYPVPDQLPDGVSLRVPLPSLSTTHRQDDPRRWTAITPTAATSAAKTEIPAAARIGNLDEARTRLGRRELPKAWEAVLAAVQARPFHPEAFLLLAEIALAAGDAESARRCAQFARRLAPGWKAPSQFLQKPLTGNVKSDWLVLPEGFRNSESKTNESLTVCVIARNEEQFLDQCLSSVQDLDAQIVVVDTGSTDRTIEIARRRGATVVSVDWCDDFSAARNAALEHATGDWILMLDADEELPADQHDNLTTHLRRSDVIAYRLPLGNHGKEAEGQSYVPRLFRNVPGAFYQGRIHEQIFPNLIALSKGWGLKTSLGSARLLHHGYRQDLVRDRNKVERNLRLLRQAIQENPGDVNLTMNLGLELTRSGDRTGGLAQYREAFRLMSALPAAGVVPELHEALLTQLTSQLYQVRAHDEVVGVLTSPLAKLGGGLTASLHFALGLSHFELKNFREAAAHMNHCLAKRGRTGLTPINTDILTAAPRHCLALSLARLGDRTGAEKEFQQGLKETGRTEELAMDYARFLAEQKRPVEALQRLHELVMRASENAIAWRLGGEIALSRTEFLDFAADWSGEALGHLPADPTLIAQRAEVLLLKGQTTAARPLWEKTCNGARPARALAAWILCSAAATVELPEVRRSEEPAVSRAFIDWYQKLLSAGARETLLQFNTHLDALRPSLPTAAQMLESALAEAGKQPA